MELKENLIDKILRYVECRSNGIDTLAAPEFKDYSPVEVHYHIGLCEDAGFLEVTRITSLNESEVMTRYRIKRLTWHGHQRLKGEL